jgi:TPR repeat protein
MRSCEEYGQCGHVKNEDEALRQYRLSAEQCDPRDQAILGNCYEYGRCGLVTNVIEDLRLYHLSAEQGDIHGQRRLARCQVRHNV